jgi:hypothetical protein
MKRLDTGARRKRWKAASQWAAGITLVVMATGLVIGIVMDSQRQDINAKWKRFIAERKIPREYFYVDGVYRPEPWE